MISEQFNDFSSLNNMAFNLFIHHMYYCFECFVGHSNGHKNDFLIQCHTNLYEIPFLVRTINLLKSIVRF